MFSLVVLLGYFSAVFQSLWFRKIQLLTGNTQLSLISTLIVFFLGSGLGSIVFDPVVRRIDKLLIRLLILCFGVVFFSLAYFFTEEVAGQIFRVLTAVQGDHLPTFFSLAVAVVHILLPSFFFGGLLPISMKLYTAWTDGTEQAIPFLYGLYSLSAAVGILVMGFVFPFVLGYEQTFIVHVSLFLIVTLFLTGGVLRKSRTELFREIWSAGFYLYNKKFFITAAVPLPYYFLAFSSGFLSFTFELTSVRLLALVVRSSLFSITSVQAVIIVGLSVGAFSVALFIKKRSISDHFFALIGICIAIAVAVVPWLFTVVTDGYQSVPVLVSHTEFLQSVIWLTTIVLFIPLVLIGFIFPATLGMVRKHGIGSLFAVNLLGVSSGLLVTQEILLPHIAVMRMFGVIAVGYLLIALVFAIKTGARSALVGVLMASMVVITMFWYTPTSVMPETLSQEFTRITTQHSAFGPLTVVERKGAGTADRRLLLNNHYTLGGSQAVLDEQWQTHLPLLLHPQAASLYYIGMGTGLTASAAQSYPVESVVITELIEELTALSEQYFLHQSLLADDRFQIINTDGRTYLQFSEKTYDVIIGDLFDPWAQGASDLYSVEHFQTVKNKLNDQGIFVQWIPVHEWQDAELALIIKSMKSVFERVTVWKGTVSVQQPVIGLIGHTDVNPLSVAEVDAHYLQLVSDQPELESVLSQYFIPSELIQLTGDVGALPLHTELLETKPSALLLQYYIGDIDSQILTEVPDVNSTNVPIFEYIVSRSSKEQSESETEFLLSDWLVFMTQLLDMSDVLDHHYLGTVPMSVSSAPRNGLLINELYYYWYLASERGDDVVSQQFFVQQIAQKWQEYTTALQEQQSQ